MIEHVKLNGKKHDGYIILDELYKRGPRIATCRYTIGIRLPMLLQPYFNNLFNFFVRLICYISYSTYFLLKNRISRQRLDDQVYDISRCYSVSKSRPFRKPDFARIICLKKPLCADNSKFVSANHHLLPISELSSLS